MILHCAICSLDLSGKIRLTKDSAIAIIDEGKIRLPLDGSMFKPLLTPGGDNLSPIWVGEPMIKWDEMSCFGRPHSVFGEEVFDTQEADKVGGPRKILTDQGWIEIDEEGIVGRKKYVCDICGKKFSHFIALKGHQRTHKKEINGQKKKGEKEEK